MITFSSDLKKISKDYGKETNKIAEDYFKTSEDPSQAKITEKRSIWLREIMPESLNIIKSNNQVVGFTLSLPCKIKKMDDFISKRITEEELFQSVEQKTWHDANTIYLCSAVIIPEFRKKGLALEAFKKSIDKIKSKINNSKPTLFFWKYSNEGEKLAQKIAKELKLELKERKD